MTAENIFRQHFSSAGQQLVDATSEQTSLLSDWTKIFHRHRPNKSPFSSAEQKILRCPPSKQKSFVVRWAKILRHPQIKQKFFVVCRSKILCRPPSKQKSFLVHRPTSPSAEYHPRLPNKTSLLSVDQQPLVIRRPTLYYNWPHPQPSNFSKRNHHRLCTQ